MYRLFKSYHFGVSTVHRMVRLKPDTTYVAFICAVIFAASVALLPAAPQPRTFDLEEATIADLQRRMTTGQDTARSLAEKYLARIDTLDRRGPSLDSIIQINPDALTIAD